MAKLLQCFRNEVSELSAAKKLVGRKPYEEGRNLPNSISEDIGSFSLHPSYSRRQLRRVNRLKMRHSKKESRQNLQKIIHMEKRLQC